MPARPTTTDRALAFSAATLSACADHVAETPFGHVLHTPTLPAVWSLNAVVVERPGVAWDDLTAVLPEAPRPSMVFEDADDADRFARELEGWERDTELLMVLGDPPAPPPPAAVRDATRDEIRALQRQWLEEDFAEQGPGAVDDLVQFMERQWVARVTRAYVSPDASAMTLLWSDGATAQVEDVYTRPDARGRGHARALVSHVAALAAAEHDLVFLVADDDNTPKELYSRLGFTGVHRIRRYVGAPGWA